MSVRDSYPGGECPDCGQPIPAEANDGDECVNCGHIFFEDPAEDQPIPAPI